MSIREKINYEELRELLRSKASEIFRNYSVPRWMLFLHDILAVFITFLFAYFLRFNLIAVDFPVQFAFFQGIITVAIYSVLFIAYRSYAGLIRHTTLTDVSLASLSTSTAALILVIFSVLEGLLKMDQKFTIPISVVLIHYVVITVYLFFMRISVKMLFRFATHSMKGSLKRVLIYGAGEMGFVVKRVLLSDPKGGFTVSGFIDDNRNLIGKKINGIHVYSADILNPQFLIKNKIETLILAMREISPTKKGVIIKNAMDSNIEILETPAIEKWLNGRLEVQQLQKVRLEDLLGRDPIKLNLELIRRGLNHKTILITGAAGSIGSEIVRQLCRFSTKNLILVDQAETPVFHLENELRKKFRNVNFKTQLADITNVEKMEKIFDEFHPDIVFHAAAYKHVPLMEANPHEALRVNAGGTKILTELAVKHGVKKFVMVSSDKSVNPTNVMGASKRVCEIIVQAKAAEPGIKTQFVVTRFGNVLGSNGSVIPLFRKQIEDGGPVTVTHPEISRYFMTIPEACQLVLEAGFMGKGGEIFVFDMGELVKIADLANTMIRLSGLEPGKDIKIEYTGLRPGEKLYEELMSNTDEVIPTYHEKIKIARVEKKNFDKELLLLGVALKDIYNMSEEQVVLIFEKLVPEYKLSKEVSNGHFLSKKKLPDEVKSN